MKPPTLPEITFSSDNEDGLQPVKDGVEPVQEHYSDSCTMCTTNYNALMGPGLGKLCYQKCGNVFHKVCSGAPNRQQTRVA